jgi:hypothetical protein
MLAELSRLFWRAWWVWPGASRAEIGDWLYRGMNLAEGVVWLVLAVLVLVRWGRRRHSPWECAYAALFATFGLSDFIEAGQLTTWLILAKLANLIGLLWMRAIVLGRYYPASRTY